MAKKRPSRKKSPAPAATSFRVVSVAVTSHGGVCDAPDGVLEQFQVRCRSREELFEFLTEYASEHRYFGLDRWSEFNDSLDVSFEDVDGGSYVLGMYFGPWGHLRRYYPDDTYAEVELPVWGPFESALREWRGSDKPPDRPDGRRPR